MANDTMNCPSCASGRTVYDGIGKHYNDATREFDSVNYYRCLDCGESWYPTTASGTRIRYPQFKVTRLSLCLLRERVKHQWSLRELAERSGVSAATLSRIENGSDCQFSQVEKVAQAFGLSVAAFLGEKVARNED